jgi:hypothetical protein
MKRESVLNIVILVIQVVILILTIVLTVKYTKGQKDSFCNCFGAQYNGSRGDPQQKNCYGGVCYDPNKIAYEYQQGKFAKTFSGV